MTNFSFILGLTEIYTYQTCTKSTNISRITFDVIYVINLNYKVKLSVASINV